MTRDHPPSPLGGADESDAVGDDRVGDTAVGDDRVGDTAVGDDGVGDTAVGDDKGGTGESAGGFEAQRFRVLEATATPLQ